MKTYDIGDRPAVRVQFKTAAGTLVDPTAVKLVLRPPSGTETVLVYGVDGAVIKDAVGEYHYDWALTVADEHSYRWIGTGAVVAAGERKFKVRVSDFTQPLP